MREEKREISKEKRVKSEEKRVKREERAFTPLLSTLYSLLFTLYSLPFTLFGEVATAPLNDIPGTAHVVTNVVLPDVAAIVTNEVVSSQWGPWSYTFFSFVEPDYDPCTELQSLEWVESGDRYECTFPCWRGVFTCKRTDGGYYTCEAYSGFEGIGGGGRDAEELTLYTESARDEGFKVWRSRIEERTNALGLATLKDIEQLPTASTVTNIVRDNIGTIWDDALGVAWQARMHNGHLYYIAVTNRQEVK